MQHKVKVTVIDKKLYPELQKKYCMDPDSGACPCYQVYPVTDAVKKSEARLKSFAFRVFFY